ncbi:MAG: ferrichrome ABC transporter substrate-binding protein, partial [Solibacillus isronensis]
MKKWKFLTAAALTLMLAACGSDDETSTKDEANEPAKTEETTTASETSAFPMTVSSLSAGSETEDGKSLTFDDVTFEEMPKNIVVFDYGFLDTLDALGVEGIVGIAANGGKGNFPEHLKEKYLTDSITDVGSLKQ